jgi:hypothetical protein
VEAPPRLSVHSCGLSPPPLRFLFEVQFCVFLRGVDEGSIGPWGGGACTRIILSKISALRVLDLCGSSRSVDWEGDLGGCGIWAEAFFPFAKFSHLLVAL